MDIVPFTPAWSPAVQDFNRRLIAAGLDEDLAYPEMPQAEFSLDSKDPLWQEFFLATEENVVRGGYFLTHEHWYANGQNIDVANYRLPLSEGLVNEKYRGVSLAIMRHALKRQPLMYCLGMGSYERPLPRSLRAMKWPMFATPFFFRARRPGRLLRNIHSVRCRSILRRMLFDAAAFTGVASAGIGMIQALRTRRPSMNTISVQQVSDFGEWADELWLRVRDQYSLLARRDAAVLRTRYPIADSRLIRLKIERAGAIVGWAILLDTTMRNHKHFGNLRVGTIVDCFGEPSDAVTVVQSAAGELAKRGVDVVVSNQTHTAWCQAFRASGFFEGPSNRIFAASPSLADLVQPFEAARPFMHLTRGDAAGPIHL